MYIKVCHDFQGKPRNLVNMYSCHTCNNRNLVVSGFFFSQVGVGNNHTLKSDADYYYKFFMMMKLEEEILQAKKLLEGMGEGDKKQDKIV